MLSEFLLGEDILVAPVLEEGKISRDIYLPRGKWVDQNYNVVYTGPIWITNYSANLTVLPYFIRSASVMLSYKITLMITALMIVFSIKF